MIINPLSGQGRDNLFSTHPATQNRIDRLMQMSSAGASSFSSAGSVPASGGRGPWG